MEGSPPISVVWLKDKGEVIRESQNVQMWFMDNIATLEIASAEGTDVGKYICQIKNDAGMRECSAFLQVLGGYSLLHRYYILYLAQLPPSTSLCFLLISSAHLFVGRCPGEIPTPPFLFQNQQSS